MPKRIAVIGGTALQAVNGLKILDQVAIKTPYGDPSSEIVIGQLAGTEVVFVARHGQDHSIAPHKINYRANIWSLQSLKVESIIGIASVGGITEAYQPATLAVPDQLVDYSHGRVSTFHEQQFSIDKHIDFTEPYDAGVRKSLVVAAERAKLPIEVSATMAVTQGPRLETAAEINRLKQDGCDLVGMTGMPEAVLARELDIPYASLAVIVNWAAGISDAEISIQDIQSVLKEASRKIEKLVNCYCQ